MASVGLSVRKIDVLGKDGSEDIGNPRSSSVESKFCGSCTKDSFCSEDAIAGIKLIDSDTGSTDLALMLKSSLARTTGSLEAIGIDGISCCTMGITSDGESTSLAITLTITSVVRSSEMEISEVCCAVFG